MKDFKDLEFRLQNLLASLDGDLWRKMVNEINPPRLKPDEQETLDMVYRDSKALGGYIPDLMAIMRKNEASELDADNRQALIGILGILQLMTRILLMILLIPRYHEHEDLITTFNGYRQSLKIVEEYLADGTAK